MKDEISIRSLAAQDLEVLLAVGPGVFDHAIRPEQARAFLADPGHELVLAFAGSRAVGLCSATVLLHPDKPPALFINEVGTHRDFRRRGVARRMISQMISIARARGCHGVWLGAGSDNAAALALYRSMAEQKLHGVFFGWDGALDEDMDDD